MKATLFGFLRLSFLVYFISSIFAMFYLDTNPVVASLFLIPTSFLIFNTAGGGNWLEKIESFLDT